MKTRKIIIGLSLFAILLTCLVLSAAGSVENDASNIIELNYVSVDDALKHANVALNDFIEAGSPGLDGTNWTGATLNEMPLTIYDINDKKLFYQFSVEKDGECIGIIRTSASKVLGSPIVQIGLKAPSWDSKEVLENTIGIAKSQYTDYEIDSATIVCYSYPKIGVKIQLHNPKNEEQRNILLDAVDYSMILDSSSLSSEISVWSIYEKISLENMTQGISAWEERDMDVDILLAKSDINVLDSSSSMIITRLSSDTISGFYLFGQEDDWYCAPAVGQMIADYYNIDHSQDFIAGVMGTIDGQGTSLNNEIAYYRNNLNKQNSNAYQFSNPWTADQWLDVKDMISANKPFASRILGHDRACAGWGEFGDRYLYIYDPWPVNEGDIYWEAEGCCWYICNIYVQ